MIGYKNCHSICLYRLNGSKAKIEVKLHYPLMFFSAFPWEIWKARFSIVSLLYVLEYLSFVQQIKGTQIKLVNPFFDINPIQAVGGNKVFKIFRIHHINCLSIWERYINPLLCSPKAYKVYPADQVHQLFFGKTLPYRSALCLLRRYSNKSKYKLIILHLRGGLVF